MDCGLGMLDICGVFFGQSVHIAISAFKKSRSFLAVLSWQLFSGYVWFAISLLIIWLSNKFPFEKGRWKTSIPIHLIASIVISLFQQAIDAFVLPKLGYKSNFQQSPFFETYKVFLFVNLHFSVAIYWTVLGIYQSLKYYQKYPERGLLNSQLEARLAQSRLQVLKLQLHPHFLFNLLNAIQTFDEINK
jgi:amino acid transporter